MGWLDKFLSALNDSAGGPLGSGQVVNTSGKTITHDKTKDGWKIKDDKDLKESLNRYYQLAPTEFGLTLAAPFAASNPLGFITSMLAGESANQATNYLSDGEHPTFGHMIYQGSNPWLAMASEMANPGYWLSPKVGRSLNGYSNKAIRSVTGKDPITGLPIEGGGFRFDPKAISVEIPSIQFGKEPVIAGYPGFNTGTNVYFATKPFNIPGLRRAGFAPSKVGDKYVLKFKGGETGDFLRPNPIKMKPKGALAEAQITLDALKSAVGKLPKEFEVRGVVRNGVDAGKMYIGDNFAVEVPTNGNTVLHFGGKQYPYIVPQNGSMPIFDGLPSTNTTTPTVYGDGSFWGGFKSAFTNKNKTESTLLKRLSNKSGYALGWTAKNAWKPYLVYELGSALHRGFGTTDAEKSFDRKWSNASDGEKEDLYKEGPNYLSIANNIWDLISPYADKYSTEVGNNKQGKVKVKDGAPQHSDKKGEPIFANDSI